MMEDDVKPDLFARAASAAQSPPVARLFVPGRIEFLGKHTDYTGGRTLTCAIERGIALVVGVRPDATIRVTDAIARDSAEFALASHLSPRAGHWSNYPMTVARRIAANFPGNLRGADIAFASDLPSAAGLSSSSALIIGIFLALDVVNDLRSRPQYRDNIASDEDLAGYLGTVENGQAFRSLPGDRGVGTLGGSQDHTAILCGRAGMLRQFGFCPVRHERDIPLPSDHVFVIGASGVIAEKTGAARESYNRASRQVARIVEHWRTSTGRDDATLAATARSSPSAIEHVRGLLQAHCPELLDRFEQFVQESELIVPAAAEALLRNDLPALGQIVARSQELAERNLRNQVPETIALVRAAMEQGAVAASAFGAGFGGSVWAMIGATEASEFTSRWRQRYLQDFPQHRQRAEFFITRSAPGARRLT